MTTTRRSFLRLSLLALAAPAIVRASSLMPVRTWTVENDGAALLSIAHPVMVGEEWMTPAGLIVFTRAEWPTARYLRGWTLINRYHLHGEGALAHVVRTAA